MGERPRIILDTHVLIWLDQAVPRIGSRSRRLLQAAHSAGMLAVSAFSFWEIGLLFRRRKLRIAVPIEAWRADLLAAGIGEVPVDGEIAARASGLSGFDHDPADRIIVATALQLGAVLATADGAILNWGADLKRLDVRH